MVLLGLARKLWFRILIYSGLLVILISVLFPVFYSTTSQRAVRASPQRNAQNMVSTWGAASAAGLPIEDYSSLHDLADALMEGVHGTGNFSDSFFKISRMTEPDKLAAFRYLRFDEMGMLEYVPVPQPMKSPLSN